jgi:IS1 family transposase
MADLTRNHWINLDRILSIGPLAQLAEQWTFKPMPTHFRPVFSMVPRSGLRSKRQQTPTIDAYGSPCAAIAARWRNVTTRFARSSRMRDREARSTSLIDHS